MEAYQHTLCTAQRTNLHQAMATVMQARPRYDINSFYFTEVYGKEVKCLELMSELLLSVINYQMSEERSYNQLICNQSKGRGVYYIASIFYPLTHLVLY